MQIATFSVSEPSYADYVRASRVDILKMIGFDPRLNTANPLPYATYVGLFEGAKILGFTESFLYDEAFGGYSGAPWPKGFDLDSICPSHRMAHIRTAYVEESHRRSSACFMNLYLYTARHFFDRGATHTTMSTVPSPYLASLYRKMGARELGAMQGFMGDSATARLYVFDLRELLAHPLAARRGWNCPN